MFNWFTRASAEQRQVFWICFAGWSLDAFDVQMFGLAMPSLIGSLGLARGDAGLVPSVTLVTTAIGGWLGGALSDHIGRLRTLRLAVLWFAVGSAIVALAQGLPMLLLVKSAQGFGFGAEWAAGAALLSDMMRPEDRGKAMGAVQSGWAVGWGGAVIVSSLVFAYSAPEIGWRILFGLGLLPALLVLFASKGSPDRAAAAPRPAGAVLSSSLAIFQRKTLPGALAGGLVGLGAHGGYYGLFTWLPTYLKSERHLSVFDSGARLFVIVVAFGIGCLCAGQLGDRIGYRRTVALFATACIAVAALYLTVTMDDRALLLLGAPLGFFAAGIPASLGALFGEIFPGGMKGAGIGFCYNFGRVAAAVFPFMIGRLSERIPLNMAIAIDTSAAYGIAILAVFLLPAAPRSADR